MKKPKRQPKRKAAAKQARRPRPSRESLKAKRTEKRQAYKALRERQQAQGLATPVVPSAANRKSLFKSTEEEKQAREDAAIEQMRVIKALLPTVLARLKKIHDFRNPKKVKHQLNAVFLYGILIFVYQMSSRRQANRKMTQPAFMDSLRIFFPELEDLPHHDTLNRVLAGIDDVNELEGALCDLLRKLMNKKKFRRYLIDGRYYPIAFDGTQKMVRKELLSPEWLERNVGKEEDVKTQYYVSVLEANLVFSNGMVIPLMSEFMDYAKGDTSKEKQDCEQRGLKRLANRLKQRFPRLPIMMLLDGLYSNGPVMEFCRRGKHWDFMIVLQNDSLPSVWEEFEGLKKLQPENQLRRKWGNRRQHFQWVSDIEYCYGPNGRKRLTVHVVVCVEEWEDLDENGETITKRSRHAWLSSKELTKKNVHERCNLGARHRWGIESGFLVEKHHGYQYEHCFSYDWDAMRGYHYLMRIGHALNVLAQFCTALFKKVREMGMGAFIEFVRETMAGLWLDVEEVRRRLSAHFQLYLQ